MSKLWCLVVVAALVLPSAAWSAGKTTGKSHRVTPVATQQDWLKDFDLNGSLGEQLQGRTGTPGELDEIQKLANKGLKAARAEVEKDPGNAAAQYHLGSWLLYGYRVMTTQQTTTDEAGQMRTTTIRRAVMGLSDNTAEGLQALGAAYELAPTNAEYVLDYAAALIDTDNPEEAMGLLQTAWGDKPKLAPGQKARAGLMLSDAYVAQGNYPDAREWLYTTLLLDPNNVETLAPEEPVMAPVVVPAAPEEEPSEAEPAPSEQAPQQEAAPESPPTLQEEAAPETLSDSEQEVAPGDEEQGGADQAAPDADQGSDTSQATPDQGSDSGSSSDAGSDEQTVSDISGEEGG
jgi:tetratricopeptide (TPR) repeat protein